MLRSGASDFGPGGRVGRTAINKSAEQTNNRGAACIC